MNISAIPMTYQPQGRMSCIRDAVGLTYSPQGGMSCISDAVGSVRLPFIYWTQLRQTALVRASKYVVTVGYPIDPPFIVNSGRDTSYTENVQVTDNL
ncbi:hypothetical protein DAPPUDRAFT_236855 [Daphnia pulex]|uniref:Uncharacterized protein n=1 Tax=Daphnia pulex TaxID=6669 RepID=E9G238_DAPPU|nr:hypothetical protein DAPPUDRAFT_236855 [Daphnia pulex]|eukprot:EFX86372.1 hypothetical protein DAPPUDRAFT_236855 [Daphnia pulex]